MTIARVLLFAVPRGLAASQIRELLQDEVPNADLGEAKVQQLQNVLVQDIHPEFEEFLEDTTIEILAQRLKVSTAELEEHFWKPDAPETMQAALRSVLSGENRGKPVWRKLQSLAKSDIGRKIAKGQEGGPEAYGLLLNWPVTFSGRVGHPGYCNQSRFTEPQELADEIRKVGVYRLAAAGFHLVGVAGDEFVLEIPESQVNLATKVEAIANSAAEKHLGAVGYRCCTCRTSTEW